MSANPYEAPKSDVEGLTSANALKLWNPNAAANWSLLFSPAFGAILHMKNWDALGETGKAKASRNWAIFIIALYFVSLVVAAFMPGSILAASNRLAGFVLLLSWYFASARGQAKYMESRLGGNYIRKGWGKPILFGALALIAFLFTAASIAFIVAVA